MHFQINIGCVQAYIVNRDKSDDFYHFGPASHGEYPVLSESNRNKGQKVCNDLNERKITFKEAQKKLDKIK